MVTNPFPSAAGYNNFPNGVFSPDVFAQEGLYYFRQLSIVEDITTSEYEGMIQSMGDTVHIRKQPQVTVRPYTRGTTLQTQDITDSETTLVIDQGNYFKHRLNMVMVKQSDVDYEQILAESAAYELKDAYDRNILDFISSGVAAANTEGSSGSEKTIGYTTNDYTPLDAINRLNRILTENNVPSSGRWFVASPEFYEALGREVGKLVEVRVTGDGKSLIRDKGVLDYSIHGFTMFETNNAPVNANTKPIIMAGHVSAVATATQILHSEMLQDQDDFGWIYRGLQVYGRTVLRSKALASMHVDIGDL